MRTTITMMNGTEPPPRQQIDKPPDPHDTRYTFETDEWLDPPTCETNIQESTQITMTTRSQYAEIYRINGDPTSWKRYVNLGWFCFDNCREFDTFWKETETHWLKRHQLIWYQYKSHVNRSLHIPEPLNT